MSKNLRSWKKTTATDQEETSKKSNSDDDVRCLVKIMNDKIDKLDADNKSRQCHVAQQTYAFGDYNHSSDC